MANENADQFVHASAANDHIEGDQNPRQVHGFELGAEPELHDHVSIQLTPNVQDAQDHRLEKDVNLGEQGDYRDAYPIEYQHKQIVGWASVENAAFKSRRIAVQEIEHDQVVKPGRWR